MRKSDQAAAWAVYRKTAHGKVSQLGGQGTVCEQSEWEEMERDNPGYHTLVRANIASEPEAEALARDTSGYVPPESRPRKSKMPVQTAKP